MSSEMHIALTKEIDDLKKSKRSLEKDAMKAIKAVRNSSETPEKKCKEAHVLKKAMKESLKSTNDALLAKKRELKTAA